MARSLDTIAFEIPTPANEIARIDSESESKSVLARSLNPGQESDNGIPAAIGDWRGIRSLFNLFNQLWTRCTKDPQTLHQP